MKAVPFHGANLRLTPPKDWDAARDGECLTIWANRSRGYVTTVWEPTPEERAQIAAGANIAMLVPGSTIMPAAMVTTSMQAVDEESLLA